MYSVVHLSDLVLLASSKCLITFVLVGWEKRCDVILTGTSPQISLRFEPFIFKMANPFVGRHQPFVPLKWVKDNTMTINLLYGNCRRTWPKAWCAFANICGDISCAIWFVVLVPQIWKNWKRRSVEGLSILWATANFTASLANVFFAFSVSLPVYIKILAVYMPILESSILLQFLLYSKHTMQMKLSYGACCFLIWIAVISLDLSVADAAEKVQWLAIVFWSIESIPQVCSSI